MIHNLGGGFKDLLFSSLFGEDSHFDEHIFQMGWFNHQLVIFSLVTFRKAGGWGTDTDQGQGAPCTSWPWKNWWGEDDDSWWGGRETKGFSLQVSRIGDHGPLKKKDIRCDFIDQLHILQRWFAQRVLVERCWHHGYRPFMTVQKILEPFRFSMLIMVPTRHFWATRIFHVWKTCELQHFTCVKFDCNTINLRSYACSLYHQHFHH